jgi:Zn-dependent protease with chaperone function
MLGYTTLMTALGWSLLNSIWQMAVLWVAYYLITAGNNRISAAAKHDLALVFVVMGSGWAVLSFFQFPQIPFYQQATTLNPFSYMLSRGMPFLSDIYLIVLGVRVIKYAFQYKDRTRGLPDQGISTELQSTIDRFRRLLNIAKKVQIHFSEKVETAQTSGFLKPLILLPAALITCLSPKQLEAILVHELFHIRRNDYLINIGISCFQGILFFNPFALLFCREISRERENACDDEVMERGYAPELYANALFCLEKFRNIEKGFSLAADGHQPWLLMSRIRRVLGKPAQEEKRISPVLICTWVLSIGLFGLQQKTAPKPFAIPPTPRVYNLIQPTSEEITGLQIQVLPKLPLSRLPSPKTAPEKAALLAMPDQEADSTLQQPEEETPDKIVLADISPARNYSNQPDAAPNTEDIQPVLGTPYVPSVSLSYEAQPNLTQADSIQELAEQNQVNDLVRESHLVVKVKLDRLTTELAKNRTQLKKMEKQNQQLILKHQKNIQALLKNIEQQLQQKAQKIDQLKLQLQVTDEDIIHI